MQTSVLLEVVSKLEKLVRRLCEHSSQDSEETATNGRMALYTLMPLSRVLAASHPVTFLQVALLLVCVLACLVRKYNTIQYNTVHLYCQVTNAQGMCYGTKHTHTHTHAHTHTRHIKKKKKTLNSENVEVVQRVDLIRLKK